MKLVLNLCWLILLALGSPQFLQADTRVVLITIDGVRHQDFFGGTDPELNQDSIPLTREQMMPYLWNDLVTGKGAWVFGNEAQHSKCVTDNPMTFSLPAYADLLGGVRQSNVTSNFFVGTVENPTILDRAQEAGIPAQSLAVIASWSRIAQVVSQNDPSFLVETGQQGGESDPPWYFARYDRDTMKSVERKLANPEFQPRFLFVSFNDSDEWAHKAKYKKYIRSIQDQDDYIHRIIQKIESKPGYAGNTIYIVTTDHGRGEGEEWSHHGDLKGAEKIWAVVYAPMLLYPPFALADNCSHTVLGDWIYNLLADQSQSLRMGFQTQLAGLMPLLSIPNRL